MIDLKRFKLFQKSAVVIFACYGFMLVLVSVIAFTRPYGGTGMDPVQIVQTRHKANEDKMKIKEVALSEEREGRK